AIKIVNLVGDGKQIEFDPKNYEVYREEFIDSKGSYLERGFVYRVKVPTSSIDGMLTAPSPVILKILLYEEENSYELKESALRKYLFGDEVPEEISEEPRLQQEIIIHYKRKGRNQYRTWGEFSILGTDYKGYILERPKGDNPTIREVDRRHPAGIYDLGYSEDAGGERKEF